MFRVPNFKWWLRSHQSGELTGLAYWLIAIVMAIPLYALIVVCLHMGSESRRASNYASWMGVSSTQVLDGERYAEFLKVGDALVQDMSADQGRPTITDTVAAAVLRPAGESRAGDEQKHMFDIEAIDVFPAWAAYATAPKSGSEHGREADLSDDEKVVFRRFATAVTKRFQKQSGPDPMHIERSTARAVGLPDTGVSGDGFDVPWMYVASDRGAIAVFPGTPVIADQYDTKERPGSVQFSKRAMSNLRPRSATDA